MVALAKHSLWTAISRSSGGFLRNVTLMALAQASPGLGSGRAVSGNG